MTDALRTDWQNMEPDEIERVLAEKYPAKDFDVHWWWDWPEEKIGFCLSVAYKHAITISDFDMNLYQNDG